MTTETDAARFWAKVDKTKTCWLWTAYKNAKGYGRFQFQRRSVAAHRWSYELHFGPVPNGLVLDHLCRTRHCVNPDHLEPVTSRENTLRGNTVAARHATKTHCDSGHEYTPENTRISTAGRRYCRACVRIQSRAKRARKRGNSNSVPTDPYERFWSKVNKTAGCWLWEAGRARNGYGRFATNGRMVLAHRFAYEIQRNQIPTGLQLRHSCGERLCVNPDHLELVTVRENLLRSDTTTARNVAKTHCPKGHAYTPENTYVAPPNAHNPNGFRRCRTCKRQSSQAHERRVQAARMGGAS